MPLLPREIPDFFKNTYFVTSLQIIGFPYCLSVKWAPYRLLPMKFNSKDPTPTCISCVLQPLLLSCALSTFLTSRYLDVILQTKSKNSNLRATYERKCGVFLSRLGYSYLVIFQIYTFSHKFPKYYIW